MTKQRDEPRTTYLSFAELHEPLPQGRYAGVEPRKVVGASATYEGAPQQPGDSPWSRDPVPDEPSLGVEIDAPIDIGEPPSQQPSVLPCGAAAADGEEASRAPVDNLPTVEARTLPKQRRKLT
jgi:hypothetical protein